MTYEGFALEVEDVLALPVDELALRILRDVIEGSAWSASNWKNWMKLAEQNGYPGNQASLNALGEAWHWLFRKGLVMPYEYGNDSTEVFGVTRLGKTVHASGLGWLKATERLDLELVPELERTARPQFMRGDFETAAFVAMKEVEVAVRTRGQLSDSLVGTKLVQEAFKDAGPLRPTDIDGGEAVALMDIFKGAIGLFKNPSSHRRVTFTDPIEAAEIVLLADLLLRILHRLAAGQQDSANPK